MDTTENKDVFCDIETGICAPDTTTHSQKLEDTNPVQRTKAKLVYYYDALCGWCYGFSLVMSKIHKTYSDRLNIDVVSGGLFLGTRVGSINEVAPYIKAGAYKSVEGTTGVKFGETFLADVFGEGKMMLNSLPPAIALFVVKEKFPEREFEFAEMLLHAVYFDGMNPINIEEYTPYIEKIGFDEAIFFAKMKEDKYKALAEKDFEKFRVSGFSGMPALVLETEDKQIVLSNGYTAFKNVKSKLDQLLTNQ